MKTKVLQRCLRTVYSCLNDPPLSLNLDVGTEPLDVSSASGRKHHQRIP